MCAANNDSPGLDQSQLNSRASSLDIDAEAIQDLSKGFVDLAQNYFANVSGLPVFPQTTGKGIGNVLDQAPPIEAQPLATLMSDCQHIIEGSRHNGHPRFFGYVASPATPAGAFADLLASTINPSVTSWRSAPAATQVERTVVRWLGSLIGYDEDAHGLLTSGGSMANLTALLIAHRAKTPSEVSQNGMLNSGERMMIYASDQVHLSILK